MPIFQYRCQRCEHEFETIQKRDAAVPKCAKCGHDITTKIIAPSNFSLKGTGWYKTDYKNK
jgi:putative FmdB family regulatory protein